MSNEQELIANEIEDYANEQYEIDNAEEYEEETEG